MNKENIKPINISDLPRKEELVELNVELAKPCKPVKVKEIVSTLLDGHGGGSRNLSVRQMIGIEEANISKAERMISLKAEAYKEFCLLKRGEIKKAKERIKVLKKYQESL